MPDTIRNLLLEYRNLTAVSEALTELCGSKGSHVVTLDRVAFLLKTMGEKEGEKIAANLENLKSYIGTLGTWLNSSKQQNHHCQRNTVPSYPFHSCLLFFTCTFKNFPANFFKIKRLQW